MNSGITSGHLFACDPTHRNARNPQGCSRRLLMRHATEPRPRTPRLVTSRIRWLVCRPQQNRCEKDVASSPSMFNRRRVPTPPGRARPVSPRFGRAWRVRDFLRVNAASSHLPLLATSSPVEYAMPGESTAPSGSLSCHSAFEPPAAMNESLSCQPPCGDALPAHVFYNHTGRVTTLLPTQYWWTAAKTDTAVQASGSCRVPRCAHVGLRCPR